MTFALLFTQQAHRDLDRLDEDATFAKRRKAVHKALRLLQMNPRHPGLNTHKYHSLKGPRGEEVFEAYAENRTAAAYRIFWHYGPGQTNLTILAITAHP